MKCIKGLVVIFSLFMVHTNLSADMKFEKATFAGGCFWCMEPPFEKLDGVIEVVSGYTGGNSQNPTYEDYGKKGHLEAIQIRYDSKSLSYQELLNVFWRQVDPTDAGGQFCDRGPYYRTAIFYENDEQRRLAEESKEQLAQSGRYDKQIVTEIMKAREFYSAEDYHQDYYKKNPVRYKLYRFNCGRDRYLIKIWGVDMDYKNPTEKTAQYKTFSEEELKEKLTPLQYRVTREDGTEKPFKNEYWDNKKEGIYVDIVSGEPLFSSPDKFKSGTGWPSFVKPLEPDNIIQKQDSASLTSFLIFSKSFFTMILQR